MITVYNFPRGARGVRVFWLCEEMGLPYRTEAVAYPPSAAYLALNPLGTVPFLTDDGGVAINESVAMLLYLAQKYGPTPLLPASDPARLARVLQLTVFGEATMGAHLNTLMAAHFAAPEADKRNWSVRGQAERLEQQLGFVADLLGNNAFLVGDDLTLADICIVTAFGMWRGALGKTLPDKLNAYRERIVARPAYQRANQQQKA